MGEGRYLLARRLAAVSSGTKSGSDLDMGVVVSAFLFTPYNQYHNNQYRTHYHISYYSYSEYNINSLSHQLTNHHIDIEDDTT